MPSLSSRLLPALFLVITAASAQAIELEGVVVAERTRLADHPLALNGAGVRTFLGFRVYVASLYLPTPTRAAGQVLDGELPRRLQITMLRDTSTDQNVDALRGGLNDNNSAAELAAIKPEIERFFELIRQVQEVPAGTVIQLDYLPGSGTRLTIGNRYLGLIPGARFNRAILKIWLGGDPIQASLKEALLGLNSSQL